MLSPRFYTTDFEAMEPHRRQPRPHRVGRLIAELRADTNRDHFKPQRGVRLDLSTLPPDLRAEFLEFLVSSVTAEFSGCVLYAEIKKRITRRGHPRPVHLHDAGRGAACRVHQRHAEGFRRRRGSELPDQGEEIHLFPPKFVFYATYLSEKIGYARYITIFRHLERHPDRQFHPIFRWFEKWCADEFRHGEAFALLMRADPKVLTGPQPAVDPLLPAGGVRHDVCARPRPPGVPRRPGRGPDRIRLHGVPHHVTEICRQVFPVSLDLDNPAFAAGLERLRRITVAKGRAAPAGGLVGKLRNAGLTAAAAVAFAGCSCCRSRTTRCRRPCGEPGLVACRSTSPRPPMRCSSGGSAPG